MPATHAHASPLAAAARPGLHLVTLGVADLPQAAAFYTAFGFERRGKAHEDVAFFEAGNLILSLYPSQALARDAEVTDLDVAGAFRGITLACNSASEAEVDTLMARAASLGARILRPAQPIFWGGYMGYFADRDGHVWEIAYNPYFPFDAAGRLVVPD